MEFINNTLSNFLNINNDNKIIKIIENIDIKFNKNLYLKESERIINDLYKYNLKIESINFIKNNLFNNKDILNLNKFDSIYKIELYNNNYYKSNLIDNNNNDKSIIFSKYNFKIYSDNKLLYNIYDEYSNEDNDFLFIKNLIINNQYLYNMKNINTKNYKEFLKILNNKNYTSKKNLDIESIEYKLNNDFDNKSIDFFNIDFK